MVKTQKLSQVGEEISPDLGMKMVKDFQDAYPDFTKHNFIGKDILLKMLQQPDCQGIQFYNGLNELGEETLVYVGVGSNSQIIPNIVADRTLTREMFEPGYEPSWNWFD
jgi:hypothetical protein